MTDQLLEFINRSNFRDAWLPNVTAFLKRPACLGFLSDFIAESGKQVPDAVFVFLASIRYLNANISTRFDEPMILDDEDWRRNIDLFLVQHHDELFYMCKTRRTQVNVPHRALPIMDALYREYKEKEIAVLELGASFGLIGRCLRSAALVMRSFEDFFGSHHQKPVGIPTCAEYLGIELDPPDLAWILAGAPKPEFRNSIENFAHQIPELTKFRVIQGSALDFPKMPEVLSLLETKLPLVILTSFMLYQLPESVRRTFETVIRRFCSEHGGSWLNIEATAVKGTAPEAESSYRYALEFDDKEIFELSSDFCERWIPIR